MPRVRKGCARHKAKKRVLNAVKGYHGAPGRLYRLAKEARVRAGANAMSDRRRKKRDFRKLWITRLNAACKQRGVKYNRFIHACKETNVKLNRKMLSEIAIDDPAGFDAIKEATKASAK